VPQVIQAVVKDPQDRTELSLLYANVSPDDILLREELDALAAAHPNFRVWYTGEPAPPASARTVAALLAPRGWCPLREGAWAVKRASGRCPGLPSPHLTTQSWPLAARPGILPAVDKADGFPDWRYSTGFVSEEMVKEHLFPGEEAWLVAGVASRYSELPSALGSS
jgi:NAD(P)H-flavin reductase